MSSPESEKSGLNTQPSTQKVDRLGLFGGSFNPVHNGHLRIAGHVRNTLQLDRVLFIPTGDPPHKQDVSLASAMHRNKMVHLAIAGCPFFEISEIEMRRSGKSYSIDTVRELRQQLTPLTDIYFLIGLDAFLDFHTWREPRELLKACRFVVVPRPGHSFQSLADIPMPFSIDPTALTQLDTGNLTRLDLAIPSCRGIICLVIPPCSTSASEIRRRIRQGAAVANMLPPSVESYILQQRLYQEDRDRTYI